MALRAFAAAFLKAAYERACEAKELRSLARARSGRRKETPFIAAVMTRFSFPSTLLSLLSPFLHFSVFFRFPLLNRLTLSGPRVIGWRHGAEPQLNE